MKTLPEAVKREIEEQNRWRTLIDLPPIKVKVRICLACGDRFESAGNRTCGCLTGKTESFTGVAV